MDQNPYESPREAAYYSLAYAAWWAWVRDRIMLIVTAIVCAPFFFGAIYLWHWLNELAALERR